MLVTAAADKHPTVVADVHADVPHAASDSAAVAERS
jgi:putative methionine-R-sulfoxide reductase with GAF domain